jgi:hypothetical protein
VKLTQSPLIIHGITPHHSLITANQHSESAALSAVIAKFRYDVDFEAATVHLRPKVHVMSTRVNAVILQSKTSIRSSIVDRDCEFTSGIGSRITGSGLEATDPTL